jgi:FkbM family methyltransferase
MVHPSVPDPPELDERLWHGFGGTEGWDVGGNCGQTVLVMVWSFAHVTSFEPSPDSFAYAREQISRHGIVSTLLNIALSDHDGEVTLAYPAREQRETGQLVTVGTKGMEWEPADWDAAEKVTVLCRTADSVAVERGWPDFMKVDTEGHELLVLQGAAEIIKRGLTDMLVEFHSPGNHDSCLGLLREAGYRTEIVRHPHYVQESPMWHQHGWIRAFAPRR